MKKEIVITQDYRRLAPGQRAELYTIDVDTGEKTLVYSSDELLFEAPNWTPDGSSLLVNGHGQLWRVPASGGDAEKVDIGTIPLVNNDHVLSPDGSEIYLSAFDGLVYALGLQTGEVRLVSNDHGPTFHHFLHGVSPDNSTLVYIGLYLYDDGSASTNVWAVPTTGGADVALTNDEFADDGCEYSPDGAWVYFNSERASTIPGHAQLFRMRPDGSEIEQLTFDDRVNWFPHLSPDGSRIAYLSFPPGAQGHPADLDVLIRLIEADGTTRDLVALFGGQGTINVPSWSPDGKSLAFVAYPIDAN